jgi:hypothetical protein
MNCLTVTAEEMEMLDFNLREITCQTDVPYGGVNVVFAGDLKPIQNVHHYSV